MTSHERPACPCCGRAGTKVPRVTLESLVKERARTAALHDREFRFCPTGACSVVYFNEAGAEVRVSEVVPVVFQKSHDPSRLVCYCFSHSVREVEDEARRTGSSTVLERIVNECRRGLDRCPETNPQGSCCLGNIKRLVSRARASLSGPALPGEPEPCCE